MKLPVINKFLLILKVHYFLFQAGIAPTQTALPVYAQTLGFSGFVVGTVYTVIPLTGLIIKPALGTLADRFKWHKAVMLTSEVLILACYFSIQFIPSAFSPTVQNSTESFCRSDTSLFMCQSTESTPFYVKAEYPISNSSKVCSMRCPLSFDSWRELCETKNRTRFCIENSAALLKNFRELPPEDAKQEVCEEYSDHSPTIPSTKILSSFCTTSSLCRIDCPGGRNGSDANDEEGSSQQSQDDSVTFRQYQIYVFIVLMIGSWGGVAVVTTLSDTICIAKSGDWSLYGRQRLWGSIGYGLLSIIIGSIVDAISPAVGNKDYTPAFYSSFIVLIIDVVISYLYIEVKIPQKSKSITKDVWKTFYNPRVLIFLVWCAAIGASMGLQWTFLYWMLDQLARNHSPDTVASIKTIEGLVNGVQTFIGEVPAFFFAYWALYKIGHGHCMSLIFLIIGVRYVCYSLLINPWFVLLIEPLQIYYGLFYSTLTSYATIVAPPGTEATVQSLMCAFVEGIGVAIGSFVGGIFFDQYGGSMTFRIFGIAMLIMAVINEFIEFFFKMVPNQQQSATVIQESED